MIMIVIADATNNICTISWTASGQQADRAMAGLNTINASRRTTMQQQLHQKEQPLASFWMASSEIPLPRAASAIGTLENRTRWLDEAALSGDSIKLPRRSNSLCVNQRTTSEDNRGWTIITKLRITIISKYKKWLNRFTYSSFFFSCCPACGITFQTKW